MGCLVSAVRGRERVLRQHQEELTELQEQGLMEYRALEAKRNALVVRARGVVAKMRPGQKFARDEDHPLWSIATELHHTLQQLQRCQKALSSDMQLRASITTVLASGHRERYAKIARDLRRFNITVEGLAKESDEMQDTLDQAADLQRASGLPDAHRSVDLAGLMQALMRGELETAQADLGAFTDAVAVPAAAAAATGAEARLLSASGGGAGGGRSDEPTAPDGALLLSAERAGDPQLQRMVELLGSCVGVVVSCDVGQG